jgi:hypothetical protein
MKLEIDEYELNSMPVEIRRWLAQRFFNLDDQPQSTTDASEAYETLASDKADQDVAADPVKETKPTKAKKEKVEKAPEPDPPTAQELIERAMEFAKQFDQDALKTILDRVGAKRVSAIPEDKRAAFLAEIATYPDSLAS